MADSINETTDAPRTALIQNEGYRVLRFWNNEVLGNPDGVWTVIDEALRQHPPPPNPTPTKGGAQKNTPPQKSEGE